MTDRKGRVCIVTSIFYALLVVTLIATTGCRLERPGPSPLEEPLSTSLSDSLDDASATPDSASVVRHDTIRYHRYPIEDASSLKALRDSIGEEHLTTVLKLNRIDLRHARRGDTLMVADSLRDLLALSPFPSTLNAVRGVPTLLLVSRRVQAFAAYEQGRLVRWGPTSTGKRSTPTPAALYYANWRMKSRRSTDNPAWLLEWYVNFENFRGISFHKYGLPGYPGSHACVRLLEEDARWIYDWTTLWILSRDRSKALAQGTPVIVFGDYAYGETPPWKKVSDDPLAAIITMDEIEAMLHLYLAPLQAAVHARYAYQDSLSRHLIGVPF